MSTTMYWLQCGACSGDSMTLLGMDAPDLIEVFELLQIELLWHPSLSAGSHKEHRALLDALVSGEQRLDVLCIEGSIARGPSGSGMYDVFDGKPKKDLVAALARQAGVVIAVGTCASFGGICGEGPTESTGVQFHKGRRGGFLGPDFVAKSGLPVVNLPGCPCHCEVVTGTLQAVIEGVPLELTEHQSPALWFGTLIHQGCVRNEYHEYRVEERDFGERGCLFFHLGCRGPLAYGPCNKLLWHRRSSKTRVGVPCMGCTMPDFPSAQPFFQTRSLAEVPVELPAGVDRAHYLAYKSMAAAAAPERLRQRKTRV